MVLIVGHAGNGTMMQLVADHDVADRWQAQMDSVSRNPVRWERFDVKATGVVEAVAEMSKQMLTH